MLPEPAALVRAWLQPVVSGTPVTTMVDAADSFPQAVITVANWSQSTQADGRPSRAFPLLDVAVTVWGAGGDRPDFQTAWAVVSTIVDAAATLSDEATVVGAVRLTNSTGHLTSRSVDAETGCAQITVSFTVNAHRLA